jgi:hypothetical protein
MIVIVYTWRKFHIVYVRSAGVYRPLSTGEYWSCLVSSCSVDHYKYYLLSSCEHNLQLWLFVFILCSVFFIVCVVLCAVFRLIVVIFCVMCVIYLLCPIVNHCHRVKTHLQLINITLHYIITTLLLADGVAILDNKCYLWNVLCPPTPIFMKVSLKLVWTAVKIWRNETHTKILYLQVKSLESCDESVT